MKFLLLLLFICSVSANENELHKKEIKLGDNLTPHTLRSIKKSRTRWNKYDRDHSLEYQISNYEYNVQSLYCTRMDKSKGIIFHPKIVIKDYKANNNFFIKARFLDPQPKNFTKKSYKDLIANGGIEGSRGSFYLHFRDTRISNSIEYKNLVYGFGLSSARYEREYKYDEFLFELPYFTRSKRTYHREKSSNVNDFAANLSIIDYHYDDDEFFYQWEGDPLPYPAYTSSKKMLKAVFTPSLNNPQNIVYYTEILERLEVTKCRLELSLNTEANLLED